MYRLSIDSVLTHAAHWPDSLAEKTALEQTIIYIYVLVYLTANHIQIPRVSCILSWLVIKHRFWVSDIVLQNRAF